MLNSRAGRDPVRVLILAIAEPLEDVLRKDMDFAVWSENTEQMNSCHFLKFL